MTSENCEEGGVYCAYIIFARMLGARKFDLLLRICATISACMLLPLFLPGQTQRIDNLRKEFYSTNDEPYKVSVLLSLLRESRSMTSDSLLLFVTMADKLVKPNTPEYFISNTYKGLYFLRNGDGNSALLLLDKLLAEIPKNDSRFFNAYMQILYARAVACVRNNRNKDAIQDGFTMLKLSDVNNSSAWKARANLLLGYANMELLKYNVAIDHLHKCISLLNSDSLIAVNIYAYSNIASCFNNINQLDSAFKYIELAIKYGHQFENLSSLSNSLNIRADMYLKQKQNKLAMVDLEEALQYRKQAGDLIYIISDMAQLSEFYASVGQTKKGIQLASAGIETAREKKMLAKQIYLMNALAENYKVAGLRNEYEQVLLNIIALKDSLYQKNSADDIAGFEAKYQLQKKENIIILQESKLAKNRYTTYGIIALLTFIFIASGLLYRNAQLKRQHKYEQKLMEQELLAKENLNKAMETERKRIAADMHDNLGAYAAAITNQIKLIKDKSDIHYMIIKNLESNAASMVSQLSDTIWVLKNQELTLTNLSDRFKSWIQKLMKSYPDIDYHFKETIEKEYNFTPVNALHVFYILTECVNNALQHSGCTEIVISFSSSSSVEIIVSDNGKGMHPFYSRIPDGNGIGHIKKRTCELGWWVRWEDNHPQGTNVVLSNTT